MHLLSLLRVLRAPSTTAIFNRNRNFQRQPRPNFPCMGSSNRNHHRTLEVAVAVDQNRSVAACVGRPSTAAATAIWLHIAVAIENRCRGWGPLELMGTRTLSPTPSLCQPRSSPEPPASYQSTMPLQVQSHGTSTALGILPLLIVRASKPTLNGGVSAALPARTAGGHSHVDARLTHRSGDGGITKGNCHDRYKVKIGK